MLLGLVPLIDGQSRFFINHKASLTVLVFFFFRRRGEPNLTRHNSSKCNVAVSRGTVPLAALVLGVTGTHVCGNCRSIQGKGDYAYKAN